MATKLQTNLNSKECARPVASARNDFNGGKRGKHITGTRGEESAGNYVVGAGAVKDVTGDKRGKIRNWYTREELNNQFTLLLSLAPDWLKRQEPFSDWLENIACL